MKTFNKNIILLIIAEYLVTLILVTVAFNFFKIFGGPVKRGFFCNDDSLKYPNHSDTINGHVLLVFSFYIPIALIAIGEGLTFLLERRRTSTAEDNGLVRAFLKLHYNLTAFLCGFALHALFVHAAKIIMGRLRPNFFDVCQPYRRLDGSTCDNPKNHGIYIQDYECNTTNENIANNVHISFPSGHSSYMFYGMIFIILYLQRFSKIVRQQKINVGLFTLVVQMFCILLAWLVALSRVMDNKHHWSDVLVGIVLGTSVAIAVTLYLCQQLESVNSCPDGVKSSNSDATSTTTFTASTPNATVA